MKALEGRLIHWVEGYYGRITVLGLLLLLALAFPLSQLQVGNDLTGWIAPADLSQLKSFQKKFGHEASHLFAFPTLELFQELPATGDDPPATRLDHYLEWVAGLAGRPGIIAVLDPVGAYLSSVEIGGLDLDFRDEAALVAARRHFLHHRPAAWGDLVSQDMKTLGLLIILEATPHAPATLAQLQQEFNELGLSHHQAGVLWFSQQLTADISRDLTRVVSLLTVVSALLLWFFFRSMAIVVAIFFGVAITLAVSLVLCLALGSSLNLLTLILFPLAFSVCLNSAIYLFGRRQEGMWSFAVAFHRVFHPTLLATLTSAVGSCSFFFAPQPVLVTMGIVLPIAVFVALFSSLVFVPALFHWLAKGAMPPPLHLPNLSYISPGHPGRRRWVALALLGAGVVSGVALPQVTINPDALFFFAKTSPLMDSYRFIERELTGMLVMEGVVQAPAGSSLLDTKLRGCVADFQQRVATLADLTSVISFLDMTDKSPRYLTADEKTGRLTLRFRNLSGRPVEAMIADLTQTWQNSCGIKTGMTLAITGELPLILTGQKALLTSQLQAFSGLFTTVCIILFLSLRKIPILLLAVVANALPLVIMGGVMVALGIAVNSINLFVASVMLGVVVDDTIHLLHAAGHTDGIAGAMAEVGEGLWITFMVLTLSFASLVFADLLPIFQFGLLATVALVVAHLCEVFLLPWLTDWWGQGENK